MRKFILTLILVLSGYGIFAQKYPIAALSDSIMDNAYCVIREYSEELTLKSVNSGTLRVKMVITVLKKEGNSSAIIQVPYDKNSSVSIKKINHYDGNGKLLKKAKQDEIFDYPAASNFALYSDDRVKVYIPETGIYPYTLEYEYEQSMKNLISYGVWRPIPGFNISTVNSRKIINYPKNISVNRKQFNIPKDPVITEENEIVSEIWEMNNIMALVKEPFDIPLADRTPVLYLMPSQLIFDDHIGTANTWNEYGMWVNSLFLGRDEISEEEKTILTPLINSTSDTLEKIRILYEYMQNNTRYVAIILGIGGYQPFDAKTVFENGYGECKALSNYLHALLKFAGIESFPALVSAGRYIKPIIPDFPNFNHFNHVILCVPYQNDTIWLECTSQKIPFGFLGDFTDDRSVLLLTDSGGRFAHTTVYSLDENLQVSNSKFVIGSDGTAACTISVKYSGLQYYEVFGFLNDKYEDQKKWLLQELNLPSPQIENFTVLNNKTRIPEAVITQSIISENCASFSGKYMMVPINPINAQVPIQKMLKPRISDVLIQRSSVECDTINIQIPADYIIESLPPSKEINSAFGEYSCSVTVNENYVCFIRRFEINQGRYNPLEYKKLFDFILAVSKADSAKIMLAKKTKTI